MGTALNDRLANDVDSAFPELVVAYQDRLYSGVRSFVGTADAEDVTQETFIRAHRALHKYDVARIRELQVSSWLWTIAINLCRNWARTRSRRPQTTQLSFDHADPASTERVAVDAAMLGSWRIRLDRLSEAQRTAVVLRHVVGLTYQEIAAATDRPVGTAKADVSRGLAALRRIIEEETTR
jgi:RNA polymerase sigma-70 factor (ECF subfamily)